MILLYIRAQTLCLAARLAGCLLACRRHCAAPASAASCPSLLSAIADSARLTALCTAGMCTWRASLRKWRAACCTNFSVPRWTGEPLPSAALQIDGLLRWSVPQPEQASPSALFDIGLQPFGPTAIDVLIGARFSKDGCLSNAGSSRRCTRRLCTASSPSWKRVGALALQGSGFRTPDCLMSEFLLP